MRQLVVRALTGMCRCWRRRPGTEIAAEQLSAVNLLTLWGAMEKMKKGQFRVVIRMMSPQGSLSQTLLLHLIFFNYLELIQGRVRVKEYLDMDAKIFVAMVFSKSH